MLDYVQLVFEEERFSLYNSVMVCSGDTGLQRSERGFADALVSMLGKRVISATATEAEPLSIVFTDGTEIRVFKDSEGANPEAFAFTRWDGEWTAPSLLDKPCPHAAASSNASGLMPPRWLWRRERL